MCPQELKHINQACRVSFQIVKAAVEQLRRGFNQVRHALTLVSSTMHPDEYDIKFVKVRVPQPLARTVLMIPSLSGKK